MEPILGWTLLSRDALRTAETLARSDVQGVRDEIGFLALHQAYSHRFVPGTSVLHTRLCDVLFVPGIYMGLIDGGIRERVADAVRAESILALPGYFITKRIGRGSVYVINPVKPTRFFVNSRKVFSDQMIKRISHQLDQLCRDVQPSFRDDPSWDQEKV